MDQQVSQQLDAQLRQRWNQLYPAILDRFTTVSKSDIDNARNSDDLVRRIADTSHHSERFVETELSQICLVGAGAPGGQGMVAQPSFGASTGQQYGTQQPQQGYGQQG